MKLVRIIETARDTSSRLTVLAEKERQKPANKNVLTTVRVHPNRVHQSLVGFGGALTESSAFVLNHLAPEDRKTILGSYFDPQKGLGYTMARTHMNSCDFSLGNYAIAETPGDVDLQNFDMKRVDQYLTPYLQEIEMMVSEGCKLMVSPWSPPAWMKTNGEMNRGGKLRPEFKKTWALYYAKFIHELKQRGVPVWAVSIQNEPAAIQTWDSCIWSGEEEGAFASEFLGPELERQGLGHVKIFAWDHNRDLLWDRAQSTFSQKGAEAQVDGMAFHWYSGDQYENVQKVRETYPKKHLLFTEGCVEGGPRPGAWFTGERYAHNIINDLNHGCDGWIDWNLVLDRHGGPNHAGNFCDAPILVDTEKKTYEYQSSYYYLGHFSRYIRPGARRIEVEMLSGMIPAAADGRAGNQIESCCFINTDGSRALVLLNRTEADLPYRVTEGSDSEGTDLVCPPRAIQTLLFA